MMHVSRFWISILAPVRSWFRSPRRAMTGSAGVPRRSFPDIDSAWEAGLAALRENGPDLSRTPLFLVLGATSEAQTKSIFMATDWEFTCRHVTAAGGALYWYARRDGIFVVPGDIGALSTLTRKFGSTRAKPASPKPASSKPVPPKLGPDPILGGDDDLRGGPIVLDDPDALDRLGETAAEKPVVPPPLPPPIFGTLRVDPASPLDDSGDACDEPPDASGSGEDAVISLDENEKREAGDRLAHLCRRIRHARAPSCPVNGMVVLLPFQMVDQSEHRVDVLLESIKTDLEVLRAGLRVRFPVTALVTGMEEERGFDELVRRVGEERSRNQRFGKGFGLDNTPLIEHVEAAVRHAAGAFEDFVHFLFREEGGLTKPGNPELYALLCKTRGEFQDRLVELIAYSMGVEEEEEEPAGEIAYYSGCYFAATGETNARRAFVRAVFEKLLGEQRNVAWTAAAAHEDTVRRRAAKVVLFADALLAVGLVVLIVAFWRVLF